MQDYPKVKDFLMHIGTGTEVYIWDGDHNYKKKVFFQGTIQEYMYESDVVNMDLTLLGANIEDNTVFIEALTQAGYDDFRKIIESE